MAIPVLPQSAPFSPEQRAYLNGFFAGIFGLDGGAAAPASNGVPIAMDAYSSNGVGSDFPAALNGAAPAQAEPESDEETPWHDPALGLNERMELAQGRSKPMLLMAAMAQLDCGQCGYLCKSYAAAIADGSEKSLKKCVPGAKETSTKLKELVAAS